MSFIIIYITHSSEENAHIISNHLIEKKMVACSNIFPIKSAYWWKGIIENEEEWVSIVKTIPSMWIPVQKEIEKIHPYETPCIMKLEAEANKAYEDWIKKEVTDNLI